MARPARSIPAARAPSVALANGRGVAWTLAAVLGVAGVVLRAQQLDGQAFWNDEAWVALATRVQGWRQFWLAISVTPPLWAALLPLLARLPLRPEIGLRLLPFGFGVLTLWAGYRAGRESAASRLGGVLAIALLATNATGVIYAGELKPYTAEAFFALLALEQASRCARRGRTADHVRLALVLAVGAGFSNAQLLLAPPILAVLLARTVLGGGRERLRRFAGLAATVAAFDLAWYRLVLGPRLTPALAVFWWNAYPRLTGAAAVGDFALQGLRRLLEPDLGRGGLALAPALLAVGAVAVRRLRVAGAAVLVLVVELFVLAALRRFPFAERRTSLFLTSLLLAVAAASAAAAVDLVRRRVGPRVAGVLLAAAAALVVWGRLHMPPGPLRDREDLGPFITEVEAARAPDDVVLLYVRSGYVYAYYARRTPRLVPNPAPTVGYYPIIDDPAVRVVDGRSIRGVLAGLPPTRRVWFLGSRMYGREEPLIRAGLATFGPIRLERQGARALLLVAERP